MPGATRGTECPGHDQSRNFENFRRCPAAVGHEFVLDGLTLIERAQAGALDGRDMDEDVLVAACRFDEPVALGWIEPFDGALLPRLPPPSFPMPAKTQADSRCTAIQMLRSTPQGRFWGKSETAEVRNDHVAHDSTGRPKSDCP